MTGELRVFPPFRLDSKNEQLWQGTKEIRLRRKTFAVLRHLVEHAGELITKAALLDAVWPDVSVSDSMPAISVRELRKALGDDAQTPRFIETVQGRGYRFIAPVELEEPRDSRPEALAKNVAPSATPQNLFFGRERERAKLRAALADAALGRGRLCLISGEPGIGKTRLCTEVAREAQANAVAVLIGRCSEQEDVPYLPFVEILESCVDRAESPDDLRAAIGDEGPELGRLLPKLRRILPDLPAPPELSPEQARRQLFDSVCNFLARRSRERPLLLILEDLHWADESTLALFSHLVRRHSELPLLVIGTYRASEVDVTPALSRTLEDLVRARLTTQIKLAGLSSTDTALMLKGLSGQIAPAGVVGQFHGETEGNPFFVEELFRYLAEENRIFDSAGKFRPELKIGELEVPDNVRLVVGRRLARLSDVTNKILATAAVIGRSFSFELLQASTATPADSLLDSLDEAEAVQLIRSSSERGGARFDFSHELVRQTILGQLSAARRQRLHLDVAEAIEHIYAKTLEDHHSALAHHYAETTNVWKAVNYLNLAGQQAIQRSAHVEAIRNFRSALELLTKLPESPDRDAQELELLIAIGPPLIATKGYTAAEVESAYHRAMELCERVGDVLKLLDVQTGLALFYMMTARLRKAQGVAERLVSWAEEEGDSPRRAQAHALAGMLSFWLGELDVARTHLERAIALHDHERHRNLGFTDSLTGCSTYYGWLLWHMGFPDQALQSARRALARADELAHPLSQAAALCQAARLHIHRREAAAALELGEAAAIVSDKSGFPTWMAESLLIRGWALAHTGRVPEGIALMQQGLTLRQSLGEMGAQDLFSSWLAEAYGSCGRYEEGLKLLRQVTETRHEVRVYHPELSRLRGELMMMQDASNSRESELCFRSAIEMSHGHGAKSLELRATTSLARLLAQQGRRDHACAMLADIYGWFTEGFDTLDLVEAKALLDNLSR